ncbi:MAG: PAS domain S-box protein [Bacteroidia bacterium]|nr:PAS domain S-box protein [Bacteroidia bacterium]
MSSFFNKLVKGTTVESRLLLAFLPMILMMILIDSYVDQISLFSNQSIFTTSVFKFFIAIPLVCIIIYALAKILDHKLSKARIALLTSEERFRTIFENNTSAILILETDTTVSMVNDAYCKLTGFSREEVVGQSWTRLIPESDLKRLTDYNRLRLQQSTDVPDNYEFRFIRKNGEVRVGIMSVFYDRLINQIVVSFTDISERKEMEISLLESKERYRKLIEIQGEGFGIVDPNERFIFANPAADRIMGVPIGTLVGRGMDEFVTKETFEHVRKQTMERQEGNQSTYEMAFIRSDGEPRVMQVTATPTFNANGYFESTLGIFHDITDRKKIENELKKNESELKALNTTKDKLFSIVAHDLRGPIGTSADLLEVLIESYDSFSNEEQLKMLEILKNSAKSTYNLLETLLNWALIQTGNIVFKPELFSLTHCIDITVKNFTPTALSKNITLLFEPGDDIYSFGDNNMIQTVLRNLIGNAIKYTYRGGTIEIKSVNQGIKTEISITDNGMGMDEETRKNLFCHNKQNSIYGTENEKGTGLGLVLCKEFIEKHGGYIHVESEPGKGSSFIFDIPKVQSQAETLSEKKSEKKPCHSKFNSELILIVEDEDINYQVLSSILTSINLRYERAITGKEAVDKFLHKHYDLILMDVQLPEMNGWEATMKIRENDSDIPIVAVTAYASDPTKKKSMEAGCNDFVTKPINKGKLIQVLDKHLTKTRIGSILQE